MLLSEVLEDNQNARLDSEYFRKQFLTFFKDVPNLKPLGSFVKTGYRVIYENTDVIDTFNAIQKNYPIFLQATDLQTPFIKTDNLSYVHESDWIRYPKGRIEHGEILIEVKGKAEKVAIVPDDFPEKALVSGSLYKMTVNSAINKYYLLTYLICKYGTAFKDRYKTNLLISFISKDDLFRIPIPDLDLAFQNRIEEIYSQIFTCQYQAQIAYSSAENLLLNALGLDADTLAELQAPPKTVNTNVKFFSDSFLSSGRLDAEFYQKKYDIIYKIIERSKPDRIVPLKDVLTFLTNGQTPLHHDLSIGEVPFLTAEHVFDFRINYNSEKRITKEQHLKFNKTALRKGDVLLTIKGKVGNAAVVDAENVGPYNINQDVALLQLQSGVHPYYLAGFINSPIGKLLTERTSTGQINPFLGLGNVENLQIPIYANSDLLGEQIMATVNQARATADQSKHLLDLAKRAVEVAIEEGETQALALLETAGI